MAFSTPNKGYQIFDLNIVRKHKGADFSWASKVPGIDDKVQVWPLNSPEEVQSARNPLFKNLKNVSRVLTILEALALEEIPPDAERERIIEGLQRRGI